MIVSVQANLYFDPGDRSSEDLYQMVAEAAGALASLHPRMSNWFIAPSSPKEKSVPLGNRGQALAGMEAKIESAKKKFGDFDGYRASLYVSNVDNDRDWRKPGTITLNASLLPGQFTVALYGAHVFGEGLHEMIRGILTIIAPRINATFANTDVKSKSKSAGLVSYQFNRRLYQHRQFFGWMGYVPATITHDRIRDAHAVHPVKGHGTVIVSVPGLFDPADDAQVDKAHRVEMDLASYELLPVTDPNLKS